MSANFGNLTVEFDYEPLIRRGIEEINAAIETHAKELLRVAYMAGFDHADDLAGGSPGQKRDERDFDRFVANLVASLNSGGDDA